MTIYLLKTFCCSGILLLVYWFILEKEKMLRFNRFYLLFAIVFSLVIPLVTVEKTIPSPTVIEMVAAINPAVDSQASQSIALPESSNIWPALLFSFYIVVSVVMCFRFGKNLMVLVKSIRQNEKTSFENATLVLLNRLTPPHSFFNYIFVSRKDFYDGKIAREILRHELAHVKQKHSLDILWMEIVLIFAWVNPLLFLYRKSIQLNHEFLADQEAIGANEIGQYQRLLVSESSSKENLRLSSSFNYSFTKKRLIMMTKKTSMQTSITKKFLVLAMLGLSAFIFGSRVTAQQAKKDKSQAQRDLQRAQKQTQQALRDNQQAQKDSDKANKESERAKNDVQKVQKEIDESQKNDKAYVSVTTTATAKTNPKTQNWTLLQNSDTFHFKSTKPLTETEKVRIGNEFLITTNTPLPKFGPTQAQLDSFLDAAVYGVWINGKRAFNWELKLYRAEDFGEVHVSTLMKNAKDYGKYLFHVELKKKGGC